MLDGGWGQLPHAILDRVKDILECIGDNGLELARSAHLVNQHWSQWASDSVTNINLQRSHSKTVLQSMVTIATQKFKRI